MKFKSKSTIKFGQETVGVAMLNNGNRLVKTTDIGNVFPPISNISDIIDDFYGVLRAYFSYVFSEVKE